MITLSVDFERLSVKLFVIAHVSMLFTSMDRESTLLAGITRLVSSANLTSWLSGVTVVRLPAFTTYDAGQRPDLCITLAVISLSIDVWPLYAVQWEWPLKKWSSQLEAFTGISSLASFLSNVEWRDVSSLKSREITMTYGLVRSTLVMILRRLIIAVGGEPVWRSANWSCSVRVRCDGRKAGWRNCWTTVRFMIRVKTGVMEIGRKSAWSLGSEFLGMGRMLACFH